MAPSLTPEEKSRLRDLRERGTASDEEIREALGVLEQAQRVGWALSLDDALRRAGVEAPAATDDPDAQAGEAPAPDLEVLEKIGRGSQAVVCKCREAGSGRIVAVKFLDPDAAADPKARRLFIAEGRRAAKLAHPNLVAIYRVGPYRNSFHTVMEYVDGGSVADLLARRGRLPAAEAVGLIRQAAEGLAHAHRHGLIHRDIKPQNLLLTSDGTVKVADLGVARRATDFEAIFDEIGKVYGTPYYLAPEQARGAVEADHRADIYALGATLYEMVAGRPPFRGKTPAEVVRKHVNQPVPDPRQWVPDLPDDLVRLLARSLAKDRRLRYKNILHFIDALEKIGLSGAAGADMPDEAALAAARRRRRLRLALLIIAIAVGAAAVLFGVGLAAWHLIE